MSPRVSHLDNEQCRQCTSFADYMRDNKKKMKDEGGGEEGTCAFKTPTPRRPDCPLDKDELGSRTWGLLHTIAAKYPDEPTCEDKEKVKTFFHSFSQLYPCETCAADLREDLQNNPMKLECQAEFAFWLCKLHNRVNVKVGKPEFDCSKVNERWKDGWLDGSCG